MAGEARVLPCVVDINNLTNCVASVTLLESLVCLLPFRKRFGRPLSRQINIGRAGQGRAQLHLQGELIEKKILICNGRIISPLALRDGTRNLVLDDADDGGLMDSLKKTVEVANLEEVFAVWSLFDLANQRLVL